MRTEREEIKVGLVRIKPSMASRLSHNIPPVIWIWRFKTGVAYLLG